MDALPNIARQRQRECEERRRYVAQLEYLADRLRSDLRRLSGEIAASSGPSGGHRRQTTPVSSVLARHHKLKQSIGELDDQIAAARAALAAAEQELTRHRALRPPPPRAR